MIELGHLNRVDLRDVWEQEASDFTPWLAQHIDLLGEALGLDLEVLEQEATVGRFSLDLLARDVNDHRSVVIENQLESTDHSHLGQLLTYAAGFDADVVVWVGREFREEHRAALDWLNHRTGEETAFFGIVVEAWQIGDSAVAPHLSLAASPNEWLKPIDQAPSNLQRRYQDFFQQLIDTLREEHHFTQERKARPQGWYHFAAGIPGVNYRGSFPWPSDKASRLVRVGLNFDRSDAEWNRRIFDQVREGRTAVESELGELEWDVVDGRKVCRINISRPGSIDDDAESLAEHRRWMIERLLAFKRVFGPLLEQLER